MVKNREPKCGVPNVTEQREVTLDNLTSALKTFYGQETEPVRLILWHWARNGYDLAQATPELLRKIEGGLLGVYHAAQPLERPVALELLGVYGEHFFKTAAPEERAALAIAIGYTPLEYEIMGEGFSLRELMQALKTLEVHYGPVPEAMLTEIFEQYVWQYTEQEQLLTQMPELIARYRGEPAMQSEERAGAILKAFGVRLLDANNPEDVQEWKEVSGAREH
jgi:hypothetical protein